MNHEQRILKMMEEDLKAMKEENRKAEKDLAKEIKKYKKDNEDFLI